MTNSKLKNKLTIGLVTLLTSCALATADSFATLAGSGDSIMLKKGETALIMAGSGTFTYGRPGKSCSYIRLSKNQNTTLREVSHQAIPLAGPAKITVQSTDGFLGMRIVGTGTRPSARKKSLYTSTQTAVVTK